MPLDPREVGAVIGEIMAAPLRPIKKILTELGIDPPPLPPDIATKVEEIKRRYVEKWKREGYPEGLIENALEWAMDWLDGMAETLGIPKDVLIREYPEMFERALERAEKWMRGVMGTRSK